MIDHKFRSGHAGGAGKQHESGLAPGRMTRVEAEAAGPGHGAGPAGGGQYPGKATAVGAAPPVQFQAGPGGAPRSAPDAGAMSAPDAGATSAAPASAMSSTTAGGALTSEPEPEPVAVSGEADGERFLFARNTADYRPGEEARLRAFARTLTPDAMVSVHGFASAEGAPGRNEELSNQRALKARATLLDAGVPAAQITGVLGHGGTPGDRPTHRAAVIDVQQRQPGAAGPRTMTPGMVSALDHLHRLADKAKTETDGPDFQAAVEGFKAQLTADISAVPDGAPLPPDLEMVTQALLMWDVDKGNQWGEGRYDSSDLTLSARDYSVVSAAQNKCNAFLAEVVFRSVGVVHHGHLKDGKAATDPQAWFPYRASEWGNATFKIPNFAVVGSPVRGDIMCTGSHVGIYLGNYATKDLYISARDTSMSVFGIGEQFAHGIQIKYTQAGSVYRRYTP
jgi:outer membrane protein OmpA-like peptidoglycan-associated protein